MNKRQKKKLAKRNNCWHYKTFRQYTMEMIFVDNDTSYTKDMIYRVWNKKHTKILKMTLFTNCYPSAVGCAYHNGENTSISVNFNNYLVEEIKNE